MAKSVLTYGSLVCGALLAGFVLLCWAALPDVPSFTDVRTARSRSESTLLDRHGEALQEQRTDENGRRLDWIPLSMVSPALKAAVVAAEDQRFYRHRGVDPASLAGSVAGLIRSETRGASTITMQLAALLDESLLPSGSHRSPGQKWRQILSALALERLWSKEQILEAYLNLVTFRGELQGLAAASSGLFGKQPHGLTDGEAVILAALVRSPNAAIDSVIRRAEQLAGRMSLALNRDALSSRTREALSHPYFIKPRSVLAPVVAQRLFREARTVTGRNPDRIVSTLDRTLQQFAIETLRRHVLSVQAQNLRDGAVLVLDNSTGEVLAYVANTDDLGSARYVDGIQALRQAGSTLKPFIYGAAFQQHILTPASLLDDSPLDIVVPGGIYHPSNYDKSFQGPVSARTALASSLNVPAVKTLMLLGLENALQVLRAAGFERLKSSDYYGPSLALGAADISLWELANAYRSLANRGHWSPVRLTFSDVAAVDRSVMSPEAAFLVSDILSDRESRSRTFSLESPLSTRFWTAVKTGTSKDMRDNWCVGFSDRYTVAVWTGNFSGAPMWNVSGITGAAPVWVEVMNFLHRDLTSTAADAPPGVVSRVVSGREGRREWFLKGTEGAVVPGPVNPGYRILYPASGTIIALDPDIPPMQQKMFFEAQPKDPSLKWQLDGRRIGDAGALCLWVPVTGKHQLILTDASNRLLGSVFFEVRGNR